MAKKKKSLFGSSRPRIFKEPKKGRKAAFVKRRQKVKLRKRYATSLLVQSGVGLWRATQLAVVVFVVFWGGNAIHEFWTQSPAIRVSHVYYPPAIPTELKKALHVEPGENILLVKTRSLEKYAYQKHPEIKKIRVSRHWDRSVKINIEYKKPIALLKQDGREMGMNSKGELFPIHMANKPGVILPQIEGPYWDEKLRAEWADSMTKLKKSLPEFYSRIIRLETDTMFTVNVVLDNDVVIDWSRIQREQVVDQGQKILAVMKQFDPTGSPAFLKFVTADRIVMNENWRKKKVG